MIEKPRKYSRVWFVVGILLAANLAVWSAVAADDDRDHATLTVLDIGQGDAIFLRTPEGNDVLIDGGPGDGALSKLGRIMSFGDRRIELVILTHPHADHVSGLVEVLKRYEVEAIMFPEVEYESAIYEKFLQLVHEKQIRVLRPVLGMRLYLDSVTVLDVLYPVDEGFTTPPKDINDASIVTRLSLGQSQALLTGDAGRKIEDFLLAAAAPLDAEILKIGHHGSRHSTEGQFLERVKPRYAVISVGKNSYGHPHEDVLGTLREASVEILRTDESGDVRFLIYPDRVLLDE